MAEYTIYYDTRTNNVQRFVNQLCFKYPGEFEGIQITADLIPSKPGHIITYTTKVGEAPQTTLTFVRKYGEYVKTISASGNKNWGLRFAAAVDHVHEQFGTEKGIKFELTGFPADLKRYYTLVTQN